MRTLLPFGPKRLRRLLPALVAALLAPPLGGAEPPAPEPQDGWVAFEGTWSAAGERRTLPAGDREAVTTRLSGALTLLRGEGLRKGFRAEAIGYSDGAGFGAGTLVLTDDRGDQIYSELREQASPGGTVFSATIRGGTGAYVRVEGQLSFRWRHLVSTPDGEIQGMTVGLAGRYRKRPDDPPPAEAPR
jgi:hypothetical protein